jgi:hypothetical protein
MKRKATTESVSLDHQYAERTSERGGKKFGVLAKLPKRFEPTEDELEILVGYYVQRIFELDFDARGCRRNGGLDYWLARLGEIEQAFGQEKYEFAMAEARERLEKGYENLGKEDVPF